MPSHADSEDRSLRREDGFTLIEVLLAAVLGLVIVGAAVSVFSASVRSQPAQASRGASIQQARTTMERLTRELRQGSGVSVATSSQLKFITYVNGGSCGSSSGRMQCQVTYTCTGGSCTRVVATPSGTSPGSAVRVVSGLSSSSVFGYGPNCDATATAPSYVCATMAFAGPDGNDAITVQDGAALLNRTSSL